MIDIPVSAGELIDRLTILELKAERFIDDGKRARVEAERQSLKALRDQLEASAELDSLEHNLAGINARLWDIENALRQHERDQTFGDDFVELARSVYRLNDERSRLKSAIDRLFERTSGETKEHPRYDV